MNSNIIIVFFYEKVVISRGHLSNNKVYPVVSSTFAFI